MDNQFYILKNKLDSFVTKYYLNLIVKGLVIIPLATIIIIFFVSFLEYISWFSINIRFFIFTLSLAVISFIFIFFLLIPILRYFKIAKTITDRKASKIISSYFPIIDDKIVNILELNSLETNDLIRSSINQKVSLVKEIDFNKSISFKDNLQLGKLFVISVFVFLLSIFLVPEIYSDGGKRVINFSTTYEKDAGFNIHIPDSILQVKYGNDLVLDIFLEGDELPGNLFIKYGGGEYLLEKYSDRHYTYILKNVNNGFTFNIVNSFFSSSDYLVQVINVPILKSFKVKNIFPKYLDSKFEIAENVNEIIVPRGTFCKWEFSVAFCDTVFVCKNDTTIVISPTDNIFYYNELVYKDYSFILNFSNKNTTVESALSINVKVIPDLYPSIEVSYVKDPSNFRLFYFKGIISDDYGFSKLTFTSDKFSDKLDIPILINQKKQEFFYAYEFPLDISEQSVYFEISDNDILQKFKKTKSEIFRIDIPSYQEIAESDSEEFSKLNTKLDKSLLLANELKYDIKEMQKSLINDNLSAWEKKSKLQDIESKHKKLEDLVNQIAKDNSSKDVFKNSFSENSDEILKKQQEIQQLLNNVMSDDLKKLMNEISKLSEEFNSKEFNELSKDLQFNYDNLNDELDKNLQLLKKFEVEQAVDFTIEQLKKLSDEQSELSNNLLKDDSDKNELLNNNSEQKEKIDKIKENYQDILEKNEGLDKPIDLGEFDKEMENLSDDISDNSESISNDEEKAGKQAKDNADKLDKLAKDMESMMDSNSASQDAEDADALRQLLENLFVFSFKQESLYSSFNYTERDNPKYSVLISEQNSIVDDFKVIRDSLYALSSRNLQLASHISDRAFSIENDLLTIRDFLLKNRAHGISTMQRDILTNTNDLILLLSESLKNMDNMSSGSGSGSGKKSKKPKKGKKPSLSDMKKGQEDLKSQLENMLNEMKGKGGKGNKQGLEQYGKSLAQQEVMQQMLNEILNNGGVGQEATKKLNEIKKLMEANKRDLVNMNFSRSTYLRQQQIMTRLLESEKAELERDKDNKRESNKANDYILSNPEELFDDIDENINFNEIINTNSLNLFDFYKYKYQEYLMKVNSKDNEKRN